VRVSSPQSHQAGWGVYGAFSVAECKGGFGEALGGGLKEQFQVAPMNDAEAVAALIKNQNLRDWAEPKLKAYTGKTGVAVIHLFEIGTHYRIEANGTQEPGNIQPEKATQAVVAAVEICAQEHPFATLAEKQLATAQFAGIAGVKLFHLDITGDGMVFPQFVGGAWRSHVNVHRVNALLIVPIHGRGRGRLVEESGED
jgi:hypothetical protein